MNKLNEIKQQRKKIAEILGGRCKVCCKKFGKAFHFHHVVYRLGEKTYKDFESSKSIKNWIEYTEYILPIIKQYPKEFELLCQKHHRFVEMLIALKGNKFKKLITIVKRSRK